jgi:hypothetical protein
MTISIRALHALVDISCALRAWSDGVVITQRVGAALAPLRGTGIAATGIAGCTSKVVPMGVLAAGAARGNTDVTTALRSRRALEIQSLVILADPSASLIQQPQKRLGQEVVISIELLDLDHSRIVRLKRDKGLGK